MSNEYKTGSEREAAIDLEGCLVQVHASKAWFARRVLPLSIDQLRWRPGPRRWSIAECLEHLHLTFGLYLPKVDDAIRAGWLGGLAPTGVLQYEPAELEALKLIEPPVTVRVSAPRAIVPVAAVDADCLVGRFHQSRDRYAEAVRRAFGLDLARILVVEPICPPIRSLGGTLAFLAAHDRRHIWQAEQIRSAPRFPRTPFGAWGRTERDSIGPRAPTEA